MRLEPGNDAPDFDLVDHDGNPVTLRDFADRKLLIYFYPKAFTPGCTTESCDFRDNYAAMAGAGYEIVGVSPDRPEKLAEFRKEYELPFPLLSDPDHEMAEAYGAWGTKKNYGKEYEGIIRSTFVVADGKIDHAWYNVRAKGHADKVASEALA